jgi:hypothetical protein
MENVGVLDLEVMKKCFFLHKFKAAKTTSKSNRIDFMLVNNALRNWKISLKALSN